MLLSFANEHILLWRGRNWISSLPKPEKGLEEAKESEVDNAASVASPMESQEVTTTTGSISGASPDLRSASTMQRGFEVMGTEGNDDVSFVEYVEPCSSTGEVSNELKTFETESRSDIEGPFDDGSGTTRKIDHSASISDGSGCTDVEPTIKIDTCRIATRLDNSCPDNRLSMTLSGSDTELPTVGSTETKLDSVGADPLANEKQQVTLEALPDVSQPARLIAPCTEGVLSLLQQAVEGGLAIVLEDTHLDDDIIYQKTVAFSQSAPAGPVFRLGPRKVRVKKSEDQESEKQDTKDLEPKEITTATVKDGNVTKGSKTRRKKDFVEPLQNVVPLGSLRVDELAKLLA